jgi:hypothetical protein
MLRNWEWVVDSVLTISATLRDQGRLAKQHFCAIAGLELADLLEDEQLLFLARLASFEHLGETGRWHAAEEMWRLLDPMGRDWSRHKYRPGDADAAFAEFCFWRGALRDEEISAVENNARVGRNRWALRFAHQLRGAWLVEQGAWGPAIHSLNEAVRMAREVGKADSIAEALLALVKFHVGQLLEPSAQVERLASVENVYHRPLAEIRISIGHHEEAKRHALAAYKWAWADGEPYVRRYELNKARELLARLGVQPPDLPPYDPAKDQKLPWEDDVVAAIGQLRAEKEAQDSVDGAEE